MASRFFSIPNVLNKSVGFCFDFSRLNDSERAGWFCLVEQAASCLGIRATLDVFPEAIPDDSEDFVFIASSRVLSRKLLLAFDRVYIQPESGVREVDPWLLYSCESGVISNLAPAGFRVSLISSVYSGDGFLSSFLANAGALQDYRDCEHLLIRAGSPGTEQAALIEHVRRFPNAVYVNLKSDPGLYEVWNLGARLATGRYLSNANLDDRRAPAHVRRLAELLDGNQGVDVVSSALRVTTERSLSWEDSKHCEVWPRSEESRSYSAGALFRRLGGGLASRNLPHCMPLWRRSLHARVGDFDEGCHGPSADWAYWLRAASVGAAFYFDSTPLGLYLKDENSYWRQHSAVGAGAVSPHDAAIISEFGVLAENDAAAIRLLRRPLSLEVSLVVRRVEAGACLDALGYLLFLWADVSGVVGESGRTLLLRVGQYHFGKGFDDVLLSRFVAVLGVNWSIALYNALVDLVHAGDLLSERQSRNLSLACADWSECYDDSRGWLLRAFLAGKAGDMSMEKALLQRLHDEDPAKFWRVVQDVYRFSRPLAGFCLDLVQGECRVLADDGKHRQIAYYPAYRRNAYLDLLYRDPAFSGMVFPFVELDDFLSVTCLPGVENILHIHWVQSVLAPAGPSRSLIDLHMDSFLLRLQEKKNQGFKIFWTIHNYLSHGCVDPEGEIALRRALYDLSDYVFVHHPMAACLLDWLSDRKKLCLSEHGAYPVVNDISSSRMAMRSQLGIPSDGFVVMHVGQVQPYKGLSEWLPIFQDLLEVLPGMYFVLAGRIVDSEVRAWLDVNQHPRFMVIDQHVSNDYLEALMAAADVGFLSYDKTLTSGTLFHWLSVGRPVLAPGKGTISCYVLDGWSGYTYQSLSEARALLVSLAKLSATELARLGRNALISANQLEWGLWKTAELHVRGER